jgi:phosphoribosylaminoimidazole-succinocarboxamide synthase
MNVESNAVFSKGDLLYSGKAKNVYASDRPGVLIAQYRDDVTAFNGEKKDSIAGKGILNNLFTEHFFNVLSQAGFTDHHFVSRINESEQAIKQVSIIPLEVVVRYYAAGSLVKRLGFSRGQKLSHTLVEFYWKNDALGDPLLSERHIDLLSLATALDRAWLADHAMKVGEILSHYFSQFNLMLVDFKLEFGRLPDGPIILADEISPDTCRLWDVNTKDSFDKDVFRESKGDLGDSYRALAKRLGLSLG